MSIKTAQTKFPLHELIKKRWSARAFSPKPVSNDLMQQVFEAASWSFSANNAQPWTYIYAHKSNTNGFKKLFDCLLPGNQVWANEAAVIVLAIAITNFENGKPNKYAHHDLGAANMNMFVEATANGLAGHPMAGFDAVKAKNDFNLPDDKEPLVMMVFGYPGDAEKLEEPFKTRELTPRTRKPIEEFITEID